MALDLASINAKLKKYEASKAGQKTIRDTVGSYRKNGVSKTEAGSEVLTEKRMKELATEFIVFLQMKAQAYAQTHIGDGGIPTSVLNHFHSLHYDGPTMTEDGDYLVRVYFDDDLSRLSLLSGDGGRTGDGIDNIVALFNNGSKKEANYVYGWWEDHSPVGPDSVYRSGPESKDAFVRSKVGRESLQFVQEAIREFNIKYEKKYGIKIDPGIYTGHPGV